jgi:hypothetical protein
MNHDQMVFVAGFLFGFFTAGIAGAILGRMGLARNAINAPNRPMIVPTQNTPRDVLNTAAAALRRFVFWLLVFIAFVMMAFLLFYTFVVGNPLDLLNLFS